MVQLAAGAHDGEIDAVSVTFQEEQMEIGILELIVLAMGLSTFVVMLAAATDILRRPVDDWRAIGHHPMMWLAVVFFFPIVGSLVYTLTVRRQLQERPPTIAPSAPTGAMV